VLGEVVAKFAKRDNFAHWRVCRGCNFDQIEAETLSFAQSIRQLQNTQLFAGGS
jgi:hypothetical protein